MTQAYVVYIQRDWKRAGAFAAEKIGKSRLPGRNRRKGPSSWHRIEAKAPADAIIQAIMTQNLKPPEGDRILYEDNDWMICINGREVTAVRPNSPTAMRLAAKCSR